MSHISGNLQKDFILIFFFALFFVAEAVFDMIFGSNDIENITPSEFRDYWFSNQSTAFKWKTLISNPIGFVCAVPSVLGMSKSNYMAVQTSKDTLNDLKNSANAFLSDYAKNVRYSTLADFNLQHYGGVATNGIIISGTGGPIFYLGNSYNNTTKEKITQYYCLQSDSKTDLAFFNSNSLGYPVIYCPSDAALYQNGVLLPQNAYYVPISFNELVCLDGNVTKYLSSFFTSGDYLDTVNFEFLFGQVSEIDGTIKPNLRRSNCDIYKDGEVVGRLNDSTYTGSAVCDMLEKYVGMHITVDGKPSYSPVELPSDIPYDDDGNVVVCVPVGDDNNREIVYLNPQTFNNYIDNGDIITNNNNMSDYYDESEVNNVTNNYNNYNFDDSTIVGKLDDIKSKLNTIIGIMTFKNISETIGDLLGIGEDFDFDGFNLDFKSLIQTKLPILAHASNIVKSFENANSPLVIECENPLNFLLNDGKDYGNFVIDVSWYDTSTYKGKSGREYVRDGLGIIVYIVAFVAIYRRTDSILADF